MSDLGSVEMDAAMGGLDLDGVELGLGFIADGAVGGEALRAGAEGEAVVGDFEEVVLAFGGKDESLLEFLDQVEDGEHEVLPHDQVHTLRGFIEHKEPRRPEHGDHEGDLALGALAERGDGLREVGLQLEDLHEVEESSQANIPRDAQTLPCDVDVGEDGLLFAEQLVVETEADLAEVEGLAGEDVAPEHGETALVVGDPSEPQHELHE